MIQTLSAAPSCASVRIHAASASSTTRRTVRACATPAVTRRNVKLSVVQGRRGGARMGLLNRSVSEALACGLLRDPRTTNQSLALVVGLRKTCFLARGSSHTP